jgi:hypothetical protein
MDLHAVISELVGQAYPVAVRVGERITRNWVARTVRPLPLQAELDVLQRSLQDAAVANIETAYAEVVPHERLAAARPSIALLRLDDIHLLVRTEYASRETNVGDADMIAQWGSLQMLDREIELDELQGLPCTYWFALRGARKRR